MPHFLDLAPAAAVAEARRLADAVEGRARDEIIGQLDRYLRSMVLGYLQNRSGQLEQVEEALMAAHSWARREELSVAQPWQTLIGLLLDSHRVSSRAEQMDLLTERASTVLFSVIEAGEAAGPRDARPKELAARAGISEQNVNNYLRRLEKNGLISRFRPEGSRATYVFPTAQGKDLARRLGQREPDALPAQPEPLLAERENIWPGMSGLPN